MKEITLDDKEIKRLEKKLAGADIPKDEAAFIKFLIKKYRVSLSENQSPGAKATGGGGWTFTWDGYTWKYRFG